MLHKPSLKPSSIRKLELMPPTTSYVEVLSKARFVSKKVLSKHKGLEFSWFSRKIAEDSNRISTADLLKYSATGFSKI